MSGMSPERDAEVAAVRQERSDRSEDPRTAPVVLLRFYDDDHGPCGSYKVAGGVTTLAVPAGAEEMTVDLVLPEPGGLAGATDAEVLFAAERLLYRYNRTISGTVTEAISKRLIELAERARDVGYPSPAVDAAASNARWSGEAKDGAL